MSLQQQLQQQTAQLSLELENLAVFPQLLAWYAAYLRECPVPEQKIDWSLGQLAAVQQAYLDRLTAQSREVDQTLFALQSSASA